MYATNNTNTQPFLSQSNAQMIWELLQETDIYNNIGQQEKTEIRGQFTKNMHAFNDKHAMSTIGLMERNKLFIGVILNEHRKMNTSSFPTSKDVQEKRRQVFENDLQQKRNEFENMISTPKPNVPVFSDKMDTPISQMDELISQTIASRESDLKRIQMLSKPQEPTWLQETPVKHLKIEKESPTRNKVHFLVTETEDLSLSLENLSSIEENLSSLSLPLENPLSKFKKIPSDNLLEQMMAMNKKLDYLIEKLDRFQMT